MEYIVHISGNFLYGFQSDKRIFVRVLHPRRHITQWVTLNQATKYLQFAREVNHGEELSVE